MIYIGKNLRRDEIKILLNIQMLLFNIKILTKLIKIHLSFINMRCIQYMNHDKHMKKISYKV